MFGIIDRNENIIVPLKYEFTEAFNSLLVGFSFNNKFLDCTTDIYDLNGILQFSKPYLAFAQLADSVFEAASFGQAYVYFQKNNSFHPCKESPKMVLPMLYKLGKMYL